MTRQLSVFIISLIIFLSVFSYSLSLGAISISTLKIFNAIFDPTNTLDKRIIFETRLPRALTGCLTGASFALAGALTQTVTKNPMACPSLLGINQGAALGIVIAAALIPFSPLPMLLIAAMTGGLLASLLIYLISSSVKLTPFRLVLAGQAINALFYALAQAVLIFLPTRAGVILINLNGSLAGSTWHHLLITSPILLMCMLFVFFNLKNIQLLELDSQVGHSLGFHTIKWNTIFFFCIMILCSISVGLVGPILFFPLIAVYFSRIFVGNNLFYLIPFSAFFGAIFMLIADCLMRTLYANQEIPVGFFVSLIGAPLLIMSTKIKWTHKGLQSAS